MTKNNKILIGILAFMLVCVVGYALFSDNITVTGTATAQGQFMIVPSCEVITTDTITLSAGQKVSGYKSTGTGTCTIENGVIKTTSNLSKPTDEVHFYVQIYNHDSNEVPAILKKITSPNNLTTTGQPGDAIYGDFSTGLAAWYAAAIAANYTMECIRYTATLDNHWYGAAFEPVLGKLIDSLK